MEQTDLFDAPVVNEAAHGAQVGRDFRQVIQNNGKQLKVNGVEWTQSGDPIDAAPYRELENRVFDGVGEALSRIRDYATFHGLNPVSFLVNVVALVVGCVPPRVVGDIGLGDLSLNLFIVNYGNPGAGKGRLFRFAERFTSVTVAEYGAAARIIAPRIASPGSGEGITRAATVDDEGNQRATVIESSEITELAAKSSRQGSTLRATLLKAYSCERLGAFNKDSDMADMPEPGSYRLCVIVGSQKDTAGYLLDGGADGLSDRFLVVEAINPGAGYRTVDKEPEPLTISLDLRSKDTVRVDLPQCAKDYARANNEAKQHGYDDSEGTAHALETRAKLAIGLALVQSKLTVDRNDWERAGILVENSATIFQRMARHLRDRSVKEQAQRRIEADQAREEAESKRWQQLRNTILEPLKESREARWTGRGSVKQNNIGKSSRALGEQVFQELVSNGVICQWETDSGAVLYAFSNDDAAVTAFE